MGRNGTVVVNGISFERAVFETVLDELQSRKFHYLNRVDRVKTEGTRAAERRKVDRLDDITAALSRAVGLTDPTPRRVRARREGR